MKVNKRYKISIRVLDIPFNPPVLRYPVYSIYILPKPLPAQVVLCSSTYQCNRLSGFFSSVFGLPWASLGSFIHTIRPENSTPCLQHKQNGFHGVSKFMLYRFELLHFPKPFLNRNKVFEAQHTPDFSVRNKEG